MKIEKVLQLEYNLQFFAKDGEGGEKTEPATSKKLNDARNEGKVAKSKELTSAVELITLFLVLEIFISYVGEGLMGGFATFYNKIPDVVLESGSGMSVRTISSLFQVALTDSLTIMLPFLVAGFAVSLLINILQVGWKVTTKPMQPKLDKFNPINGFKRIFSKDSLVELLKAVVKLSLIMYIAYTSIREHENDLFILYDIPLMQAILLMGSIIIDAGLKISFFYLVVGFADYLYQRWKFNDDMKMTKQEVKDEYKNSEGDPKIKGQQRQRMREASQRRMMADVPTADVVITNPTHLAVAVKYDTQEASAPIVVAKGEDYLAMKIREKAKESQIEIVENKPLARMLYANVDIGEQIPPELYQAVAEVLAMVYNLKNK